jgi:hypothetical protein
MLHPHILIGIALIFYAIVLSPAFIEPSDLIQSSTMITVIYAVYGEWGHVIIPLWMATGYLALVWGFVLIGHSVPRLRKLHNKTAFIIHHPFKVTAIIFAAAIIVTIFLLNYYGQLTF